MAHPFHIPKYSLNHGAVSCSAFEASDKKACELWLGSAVRDRVFDTETTASFADDIAALKTEGFDTAALQAYIDEPPPAATVGDIGEGIADLFLMEHMGAELPTNRRRDLRTPKGSLPGADIVGYLPVGTSEVQFLFGEIKASGQAKAPPTVMAGPEGMPAQIERLAMAMRIRRQLLLYLKTRSTDAHGKARFTAALKSLAAGNFSLVGVLVRDTPPDENDVKSPAASLHLSLKGRSLALHVLHLAVPSPAWASHCVP